MITIALVLLGYAALVVHLARSIKPRDISDEELDRYDRRKYFRCQLGAASADCNLLSGDLIAISGGEVRR